MRTTLTLDDDVVVMLKEAQGNDTFRHTANAALRIGLSKRLNPVVANHASVQTRSVSLGRCTLPDVDDVAGVLAYAEGDDFA